ncbi:MAG: hypothetical protein ABI647_03400 [Gemmatimonadota bacterium]
MFIHTAGWSGLMTFFIVVFVVLPSLRWGLWGGRWGRGRMGRAQWSRMDWDDRSNRIPNREIEDLRAELDARLSEVDLMQSRVTELENRLDFAERLLAQHRDPMLAPTTTPPGEARP